jgi:hypothetical protein
VVPNQSLGVSLRQPASTLATSEPTQHFCPALEAMTPAELGDEVSVAYSCPAITCIAEPGETEKQRRPGCGFGNGD